MYEPSGVTFNPYERLPSSVEDLAGWEVYACRSFVRLRTPERRNLALRLAGSHSAAMVGKFLAERAVDFPVEGYAEDGLPVEELAGPVAARILLLRGVTGLSDLWELGAYFRADGYDPGDWFATPVGLLDRHRRGYTLALLHGLTESKVPWSFVDEWEERLPVADLSLALAAGLGAAELRAVREGRAQVRREEWTLLRGLRGGWE